MKKQLINLHKVFVRNGQFEEARKVLRLIINKSLTLGLCDIDWHVEEKLHELNLKYSTGRNCNSVRFHYREV